jgi:hypothetical protein
MGKGLTRSRAHAPVSTAAVVKKAIQFTNVPLVSSGATGNGFGSAVVAGLPEGNLLILGAVAYAQVAKDTVLGAAGVTATFTGSYSLGSAATADATLSGSETDLCAATTLSAATAGVSPLTRGTQPAQAIIDNTDVSKSINFNLELDDASVSADTQHMLVSGTLYLAYIVLGDD